MGRTRIDGDQVQAESLTGSDILDDSIELVDISQSAKNNFQNALLDTSLIDLTANTIRGGIEQLANRHFGKDAFVFTKEQNETNTGTIFDTYHDVTFTVNEQTGKNKYIVIFNYFWSHSRVQDDIIVQHSLDNSINLWEMRKEPKDANQNQRIDGTFISQITNLTAGNHTLQLNYRPSDNGRVSRMYRSIIFGWRVEWYFL